MKEDSREMTSWHLLVSKTPLLPLDLSGVHKDPIVYHDPKSGMRLAERGRERVTANSCVPAPGVIWLSNRICIISSKVHAAYVIIETRGKCS